MTKTHPTDKNIHRLFQNGIWAIKEKENILMCTLSLSAVWTDARITSLPLIFLLLCTEEKSRNICAVLSVVFFGINAVSDIMYIPYMSFVFVYIVMEYIVPKKQRMPLICALAVFAAVKAYVLSFGFAGSYTVVFMLETAALALVPDAARCGAKLLRENAVVSSSFQLAECAVALLTGAVSLSGIRIWGVNVPLCFLMSLCFFYSSKDNIALSMLCAISAVLSQWQNSNFAFVFAGFMLIGFASFALLQHGWSGYLALAAVSAGVTLSFLTQFNSFIFAITTSVALTLCFLFSKFCKYPVPIASGCTAAEKDYITLMGSVDRLGRAFRFLGSTVADISELVVQDAVPKELQDIAAQEVCRKCRNNHICWQQNFDHTQQQFSSFGYALQKGREFRFDELFASRCDKTQQLVQSFTAAHRLVSAQKLINQAGRHQQKLLQNQFFTMAQTLQDIVYHAGRSGIANTAFTHTVNSLLVAMGKRVNYCACFQNGDRCIISTADYLSPSEQERLRVKLESIYGKRFAVPVRENETEGILYTFSEVPQFTVELSHRCKSRCNVCGDICEEFAAEEYRYILLTDGMGTGSFAAAESRTALEMLKSLITAGIKPETAIDIANIALNLKGTGQSCVALDILQINCRDGGCVLYKAGGAASVTIKAGKAKNMYSDSLPIGILKDTKIAKLDFTMENGDTVIMMSDGVSFNKEAQNKLLLMAEKCPPHQLAEFIISRQKDTDDATAAVIRLTRI